MKTLRLIFTLLFFALYSNVIFAQDLEGGDDLMTFGATRGLVHADFSDCNLDSVSKEIKINNPSDFNYEIFGFEIPAGISAMSKSQIIKPKESGIVVFTYYSQYVSKSPAIKDVIVKIRYIDENNQIVIKDKKFKFRVSKNN